MPFKKAERAAKPEQIAQPSGGISRKPSTQRIARKKSTQDDTKKANRIKTPKKKTSK